MDRGRAHHLGVDINDPVHSHDGVSLAPAAEPAPLNGASLVLAAFGNLIKAGRQAIEKILMERAAHTDARE